jgi:signal transduction histidine kinase
LNSSVPKAGQVLTQKSCRSGFLRHAAHVEALRGKSTLYQFSLFRRAYEVEVTPRRDRRHRIIGTRGILRLIDLVEKSSNGGTAAPAGPSDLLKNVTRRRERIAVDSAIRSLELARAVSDSARMHAEIKTGRLATAHHQALQAKLNAEVRERHARFLADASAILDSSFNQQEIYDRLAKLVVARLADWFVIEVRDGNVLRRVAGRHRDPELDGMIDLMFPADPPADPRSPDSSRDAFAGLVGAGRQELFGVLTERDLASFLPQGSRVQAALKLKVQSLIRTPMASHGQLIGILTLGSDDAASPFGLQDLQTVRDLAGRIAVARESSMLYDEAQREIAMRRDIEARMRILNEELERRVSERTRLLEEATREANSFAYTVAHDLRAPLRAITGFCQALKEDYSPSVDAMGQDYLDRIVTGARKMDALIRDLLDYARINRAEIKRTIVELDPLIDEALVLLKDEIQERGADIQVTRPLGRVYAHGPVLAQVLTNLISNATKFVSTDSRPTVKIRTETRKHEVRILVQDNGIGIAPEHQERIFGIFERLNRAEDYPGTGIGLAIVRRAIERLGGKVGLQSKVGAGSTFWVELPSA